MTAMQTPVTPSALAPGKWLAEIRQAATEAAKRINWSCGNVCDANGGTPYQCRKPFYVTFGGGTVEYWLTDRGQVLGSFVIADLDVGQRQRVLEAIKQIS